MAAPLHPSIDGEGIDGEGIDDEALHFASSRENAVKHTRTIRSPERGEAFEEDLRTRLGVGLVAGNGVELVLDGDVFDALVRAIDGARRSVDLVMYIWRDGPVSDRVVEALSERARVGVRCRVLVDPFGTLFRGFGAVQRRLEEAGCTVRRFVRLHGLGPTDLLARSHRKILVVDGRCAMTGGFCIDDRWDGGGHAPSEWRDTNVSVRGPVVAQLQDAFARQWESARPSARELAGARPDPSPPTLPAEPSERSAPPDAARRRGARAGRWRVSLRDGPGLRLRPPPALALEPAIFEPVISGPAFTASRHVEARHGEARHGDAGNAEPPLIEPGGPHALTDPRTAEPTAAMAAHSHSPRPPARVQSEPRGHCDSGVRAAFVGSQGERRPSGAQRLTELVVGHARRRLWMAFGYFVPDDEWVERLADRARRGVDVRLLVPGPIHDLAHVRLAQRASYGPLLQRGVKIWEYQPSMMHAKTMVADDDVGVVGSINLEPTSQKLLHEGSLVFRDRRLARRLSRQFVEDLRMARRVVRPPAGVRSWAGAALRRLLIWVVAWVASHRARRAGRIERGGDGRGGDERLSSSSAARSPGPLERSRPTAAGP